MNSDFKIFSEELDRLHSLYLNDSKLLEVNALTTIKHGRNFLKQLKEIYSKNKRSFYEEYLKNNVCSCTLGDLKFVLNFFCNELFKDSKKDAEFCWNENTIILNVMMILECNNRNLVNLILFVLFVKKFLNFEEFDNLMYAFMSDSNFENTVIHEVDHYMRFKEMEKDSEKFATLNSNKEDSMLLEFKAALSDFFNRCCRYFDSKGKEDFDFEDLKNLIKDQGVGYYKNLLNYKGEEFFYKSLEKCFISYKKCKNLLKEDVGSDGWNYFFNEFKEYVKTFDNLIPYIHLIDDPEWQRGYVEKYKRSRKFIKNVMQYGIDPKTQKPNFDWKNL